jgi:hypothetical protein
MTNPDNAGGLPATGPFVDRLIRIFRDKPHDDTSALVLLEYGELCRAAPAGGDDYEARYATPERLAKPAAFVQESFTHTTAPRWIAPPLGRGRLSPMQWSRLP